MGKKHLKKLKDEKLRKINLVVMMLSALGAMLSLYLWSVHLSGDEVICVTGGCDAVLKGEYSVMADVPIAAYGFAFYSMLIFVTYLRSSIKDVLLDKILYGFVGVGVLFTLYLRYLEFVKIGSVCEWCWGSVVIVVLVGGLLGFEYRFKESGS